jgi:antitoxin component of MazEF toxin-antitoxin module
MKIERKLVQVGNSKAIIIPSEWLESKPELETVTLDLQEDHITITCPEKNKGGNNATTGSEATRETARGA